MALPPNLEMTMTDPVVETVRLYDELIAASQDSSADLNHLWDSLIGYTLDHFAHEPCTREEVNSYLHAFVPDCITVDQLKIMPKGLIPVAVNRQLISVDMNKHGFKHPRTSLNKLPNFDRFARLYIDRLTDG